MKKLVSVFVMFMLFITNVFSQITLTQEQIDALPKETQQTIQAVSTVNKISEYTSWGHEIGTAVDEALDAVEEHVINLSETGIEKKVTFLVMWRFLYKDILKMILGLISLAITLWLMIYLLSLYKKEKFNNDSFEYKEETFICGWVACAIFFASSMIIFFA